MAKEIGRGGAVLKPVLKDFHFPDSIFSTQKIKNKKGQVIDVMKKGGKER